MADPLMPKGTAIWLVESTALTFDQIADFCGMHKLEIQGIADGEVGVGMLGLDPVVNGQLESGEIERCVASYLLRYYPELNDPQLSKLIGTTKPTINAIRDRTHWNSSQIQPRDPVTIGLCRQIDLDEAIEKARKAGRKPAESANAPISADLIPQEEPVVPSRIPDWMADVRLGGTGGNNR